MKKNSKQGGLKFVANEDSKQKRSIYFTDESSEATEFRRLAKKLIQFHNSPEIKNILVTSSVKHEGKSLISAKLAIAIAKLENGKKVLLVDCDLRRSVIHSLFSIKLNPGLTSLLSGDRNDIDGVIQDTNLDNLKIMTAGHSKEEPSILLGNFKTVIDKCKDSFDFIICDTPPVVPVGDAGILVPYFDGVLLVVMAGRTDRAIVKRAVEILTDTKTKILGIAMNNLHDSLPYYYNYEYYHYKYDRDKDIE